MTLDRDLLEILACPACKGPLELVREPEEVLVCRGCALGYRIEEGIPVLLVEQAVPHE